MFAIGKKQPLFYTNHEQENKFIKWKNRKQSENEAKKFQMEKNDEIQLNGSVDLWSIKFAC